MAIDALIRGRIEERLLEAIPTLRIARYLPLSLASDGTVAIAPETTTNAVFSAVIDRVRGNLSANHSGFITGTFVYRIHYAEAAQGTAATARHVQFHERMDEVIAHLLHPPRLGFDERSPRDNPLKAADSLTVEFALGEGTTGSSRQQLLTATIDLELSIYWQAEV